MTSVAAVLHLSPREIEICALLADGESYKCAGKTLGIRERTARFHADNAARRILKAFPLLSRTDNGPRKVILRWYRSAESAAYRSKELAA